MDAVQAPLLALGVLVASGVEPDKSLQVVSSAWEHGYRGDDLKRLGKALGRLGQGGEGPSGGCGGPGARPHRQRHRAGPRVPGAGRPGGSQDGPYPPGMGPGETPVNPGGRGSDPRSPGTPSAATSTRTPGRRHRSGLNTLDPKTISRLQRAASPPGGVC